MTEIYLFSVFTNKENFYDTVSILWSGLINQMQAKYYKILIPDYVPDTMEIREVENELKT